MDANIFCIDRLTYFRERNIREGRGFYAFDFVLSSAIISLP